MWRKLFIMIVCLLLASVVFAAPVGDLQETVQVGGRELARHQESGILVEVPNVAWWYGCSPTSFGMLFGYHDRNGFANLVPGGVAETTTYPTTEGQWEYAIQHAIASPEHVGDFYGGGYAASGDDKSGWLDIYQGYNQGLHQWIEYPFGQNHSITQIRTRRKNSDAEYRPVYVWDVQVWDESLQQWRLPTGNIDYDVWSDEPFAYDNNGSTGAIRPTIPPVSWSGFLGLTIGEISTPKIRAWERRWLDGDDVDYDILVPALDHRPPSQFNSIADFMGTSQDDLSGQFGGNPNGTTSFFYDTNNDPLYAQELIAMGADYEHISGLVGAFEWVEYCGYVTESIYNQYIAGYNGNPNGFTYDDYKAEIDAGNPVIIHVENHSMIGYGYEAGTDTIYVWDTWNPNGANPGTMTWGGQYPYLPAPLQHYAVTAVHLLPEPATLFILGTGGMFLILTRKRRK